MKNITSKAKAGVLLSCPASKRFQAGSGQKRGNSPRPKRRHSRLSRVILTRHDSDGQFVFSRAIMKLQYDSKERLSKKRAPFLLKTRRILKFLVIPSILCIKGALAGCHREPDVRPEIEALCVFDYDIVQIQHLVTARQICGSAFTLVGG